jgi:hypothetical protein
MFNTLTQRKGGSVGENGVQKAEEVIPIVCGYANLLQ